MNYENFENHENVENPVSPSHESDIEANTIEDLKTSINTELPVSERILQFEEVLKSTMEKMNDYLKNKNVIGFFIDISSSIEELSTLTKYSGEIGENAEIEGEKFQIDEIKLEIGETMNKVKIAKIASEIEKIKQKHEKT